MEQHPATRPWFRWAGLLLLAGAVAAVVAYPVWENYQEQQPTVVRFPHEHAMGKLVLVDAGMRWEEIEQLSGEAKKEFEERWREARGTITIPSDKKVMMMFVDPEAQEEDVPTDLSPLDQFQQDDLLLLSIPFATLKPQEVKRLQRHRELKVLTLGPLSKFGNETLAPLAKLRWLEALQIPEVDVTDAGLRNLADLTNLMRLSVYGTDGG